MAKFSKLNPFETNEIDQNSLYQKLFESGVIMKIDSEMMALEGLKRSEKTLKKCQKNRYNFFFLKNLIPRP